VEYKIEIGAELNQTMSFLTNYKLIVYKIEFNLLLITVKLLNQQIKNEKNDEQFKFCYVQFKCKHGPMRKSELRGIRCFNNYV